MAQRLYDSDGGRDNPNHERTWAQYRFDALMTLLGIEPPPPPAPKPSSDQTTQGEPGSDPTPGNDHIPDPRSAGSNGRSGFGPMPRPANPNPHAANGQDSAPPRTKQNPVPVNEQNPAPLPPSADCGEGNDHNPLPGTAWPDYDELDGHHQAAGRTGDARQGEHTLFDPEPSDAGPSSDGAGGGDVDAGVNGHGSHPVQGSSKDPPGTASWQSDRNASSNGETANSPPITDRDPPDHRAGTNGVVANSPPGTGRRPPDRNDLTDCEVANSPPGACGRSPDPSIRSSGEVANGPPITGGVPPDRGVRTDGGMANYALDPDGKPPDSAVSDETVNSPPDFGGAPPDRGVEAAGGAANDVPGADSEPSDGGVRDDDAAASGAVAGGGVRGVSERNQIVVVAQLEDLLDPGGGVGGHIPGVGPLPRSQLERLACDAELWGLLFNNSGEPLHLGRRRRTVSSAQRKALVARDEGCVICGTQPSFCEAHHIVPWQNGGNTDIDNLALVCRRHHTKLHDQKLRLHRHPDGSWTTSHYPEMASR